MTIQINTKEQLALIGVDIDFPLTENYILMNDIDLEGEESNQWTPIAPVTYNSEGDVTLQNQFSGTFNGNGKLISGLYINNQADLTIGASLFGCVWGGVISSLQVTGSISLWNQEDGGYLVGGVCAVLANGGIVERCETDVDIQGYMYVAGVVGFIYSGGTVLNCKAKGSVASTLFASGVCCGVADFDATKDVAYIAKCVYMGTLTHTGTNPASYGVGMICFAPVLADPQIYFASDRCYWDFTKSPYTERSSFSSAISPSSFLTLLLISLHW